MGCLLFQPVSLAFDTFRACLSIILQVDGQERALQQTREILDCFGLKSRSTNRGVVIVHRSMGDTHHYFISRSTVHGSPTVIIYYYYHDVVLALSIRTVKRP